jgi:hypothetical protein
MKVEDQGIEIVPVEGPPGRVRATLNGETQPGVIQKLAENKSRLTLDDGTKITITLKRNGRFDIEGIAPVTVEARYLDVVGTDPWWRRPLRFLRGY